MVMSSVQSLSRDSLLASSALVAFLNGGHLSLVQNIKMVEWSILNVNGPSKNVYFQLVGMNQGESHFWHWTWGLSELRGANC